MNAAASSVIAGGMLKGGFDVFDALLSLSFSYEPEEANAMAAAGLAGLMEMYPVGLRGNVIGGGAVAILYTMEDATKFATMAGAGEAAAKESLDEDDLGTLKEIAEASLGGGVANLSESFGEDVELDGIEVVVAGPEGADALAELLGDPVIEVTFKHSASPHFDGQGTLLFSESLEKRVPESMVGGGDDAVDPASLAGEALVRDDEMKDILSGFSPDVPEAPAPAKGAVLENLSIVMDIELTATARLGRVEMPISEILNLGPGSIIEVGQMVDEPIELLVNDKLIARGDVVVVDEKFGLRITEIISKAERIESLR